MAKGKFATPSMSLTQILLLLGVIWFVIFFLSIIQRKEGFDEGPPSYLGYPDPQEKNKKNNYLPL
jgi:hypothetical protein